MCVKKKGKKDEITAAHFRRPGLPSAEATVPENSGLVTVSLCPDRPNSGRSRQIFTSLIVP